MLILIRCKPPKLLTKAIVYLLFLSAFDVWAGGFESLPPQQKVFKNVTEHQFREQIYKKKTLSLVTSPVVGNQGPDRALLNVLSAMNAKNYEWWVSLWDQATKADQSAALGKAPHLIDGLKREWAAELKDKDVVLWRWIETREYVMVTYKLKDKKNTNQLSEEKGIVFVLEGGLWKATKKYSADLFLKAVLKGQNKAVVTIR